MLISMVFGFFKTGFGLAKGLLTFLKVAFVWMHKIESFAGEILNPADLLRLAATVLFYSGTLFGFFAMVLKDEAQICTMIGSAVLFVSQAFTRWAGGPAKVEPPTPAS
jgi:hypothetical protein